MNKSFTVQETARMLRTTPVLKELVAEIVNASIAGIKNNPGITKEHGFLFQVSVAIPHLAVGIELACKQWYWTMGINGELIARMFMAGVESLDWNGVALELLAFEMPRQPEEVQG
jgi:hypothetical protein